MGLTFLTTVLPPCENIYPALSQLANVQMSKWANETMSKWANEPMSQTWNLAQTLHGQKFLESILPQNIAHISSYLVNKTVYSK